MSMNSYEELYSRVTDYSDEQDWESAYRLLKEEEMQGNGNALAILAQFYIYGIGVPEDIEMGIDLLEKAIAMGCSEAADELGILYIEGEVLPKNEKKGIEYISKAADMGNGNSMGTLAYAYLWKLYQMPEDFSKALEGGLKAAKLGNAKGMHVLAILYDDGLGVDFDPYQAAYWYREYLQREPENTSSMYRLSVCLSDPFDSANLQPDQAMLEEGFYWASKGVEMGDLDCHMIIAWFYESGKIVDQDLNLAYKYYKIAADNGHESSQNLIKRFKRNIYGNYYLSY